MFYTGIGSRETPPHICSFMRRVAIAMALRGYTGRSGSADGADIAFEEGALAANGPFESYLPWDGFSKRHESDIHILAANLIHWPLAEKLIREIHPGFDFMSQGSQKLHTRNMFQVLGRRLHQPSRVIFCYARPVGSAVAGGTNSAFQLGRKNAIPIYNFWHSEDILKVSELLHIRTSLDQFNLKLWW
ncbi:DprA-like protein [Shewanella phage S0112]|nr:DprA-like protein [Shewanella phage S0112]